MPFPLDKLISYNENIYELTCASIRRSRQITMAGDEDVEQENYKIVAGAMAQILEEKVKYRFED